MWGRMENGRLSCSFTRRIHVDIEEVYDLDRPLYLLVANGYMLYGNIVSSPCPALGVESVL